MGSETLIRGTESQLVLALIEPQLRKRQMSPYLTEEEVAAIKALATYEQGQTSAVESRNVRSSVPRPREVIMWKVAAVADIPEEVIHLIRRNEGILTTKSGELRITMRSFYNFYGVLEGERTAFEGDYIVYEPARDRVVIMTRLEVDNTFVDTDKL